MFLRQMLWLPRRVPVFVFEQSRGGLLGSNARLVFLGRLFVLPVVFLGSRGYFAYLASQYRLRSAVLSELRRIMVAASLDGAYHVLDWYMRRGHLCVHMAKKQDEMSKPFNLAYRRLRSWLKRALSDSR